MDKKHSEKQTPTTITYANVKLQVIVTDNITTIGWIYTRAM